MTYEPPQWLVWVLAPAGFMIAATLTYHELRTEKVKADRQIEDLSDAKAFITVLPEADGCFRVENSGAEGEFIAKAQMIYESEPEGEVWFIKWVDSLEKEQVIRKGDFSILEVATCEWEIVYTNDVPRRVRPFISFPRGRWIVSREGAEEMQVFNRDLSPRYKSIQIEVSIFSTPRMRSPLKRRYLIELVPEEDTLCITEVPGEINNEL